MTWIALNYHSADSADAVALVVILTTPEQTYARLSEALYQALGAPARVEVLYDPETRRIAFKPSPTGYKCSVKVRPNGRVDGARIACASALRKLIAGWGHAWVPRLTHLPATIVDGMAIVTLPTTHA